MVKPVVTTPKADLQILEIDAWWRENRDKAPDLFEEEFALALRMIAAAPITWSTRNAWWSSLCGVL